MKYNQHKRYALFIGRWQPYHSGHKYLVDQALKEGKNVCVGIRDTELSDKNPYTYEQRKEMIRRVHGDKVLSIKIPDIESINIGRNVGYAVNQIDPPEHIGRISGTNVRLGKEDNIPPEVTDYINSLKSTVWLTGLPCSGKTTLAKRLKEEMENRGIKTAHLDGDDVRGKINEDLGFSEDDRKENLRRVAHICRLFNENGNAVIASFVSPTNEMRSMIQSIIPYMKLVYVKCSLEECERRDVKGMFKKARAGEIKGFTGIDDPFDEPRTEFIIDTEQHDIETCVAQLLKILHLH